MIPPNLSAPKSCFNCIHSRFIPNTIGFHCLEYDYDNPEVREEEFVCDGWKGDRVHPCYEEKTVFIPNRLWELTVGLIDGIILGKRRTQFQLDLIKVLTMLLFPRMKEEQMTDMILKEVWGDEKNNDD